MNISWKCQEEKANIDLRKKKRKKNDLTNILSLMIIQNWSNFLSNTYFLVNQKSNNNRKNLEITLHCSSNMSSNYEEIQMNKGI